MISLIAAYIYDQRISMQGDMCMVSFEEYAEVNAKTELMRDVLKLLFAYGPMTAKRIKALLLSVYGRDVKKNTLYTNLEALEKDKTVVSQSSPPNGKRGRDPRVYKLSDDFVMRYEERDKVKNVTMRATVVKRLPMVQKR